MWCENVLWGHISAQRLALEGMDHFPTVEIESESNCVLPWLITGWEDRPSQQHNSIWAKYLYRGGTTSLIHNTFIHIRGSYFQRKRTLGSGRHRLRLILFLRGRALRKVNWGTQWASTSVFLEWLSLCFRSGGIPSAVSGLFFSGFSILRSWMKT